MDFHNLSRNQLEQQLIAKHLLTLLHLMTQQGLQNQLCMQTKRVTMI